MESVAGRLVVMVVIGLVGGIVAIQVLKSEGIGSPTNVSLSSSSSSSSSVQDNVIERGHATLADDEYRDTTKDQKKEGKAEGMKKGDNDPSNIEEKAKMYTDLINKLLLAIDAMGPEKTDAETGDTLTDAERNVNRTVSDENQGVANDVHITTSPMKIKITGWDLQLPVILAFLLVALVVLITLANLCCCCLSCLRGDWREETKEGTKEQSVFLL